MLAPVGYSWLGAASWRFLCATLNQTLPLERFKKLHNVGLNDLGRNLELSAYLVDDLGSGLPSSELFEYQRTDSIQTKDLALVDVEDNSSVLIPSAANSG